MRKIFMLLVACVAMVFVSCSKDDEDNGTLLGGNKGRLVSRIIDTEDSGIYFDYTYEYDKQGRLTKVFTSTNEHKNSDYTIIYTYTNNIVTAQNYDAKGKLDEVVITELNDKGYISSEKTYNQKDNNGNIDMTKLRYTSFYHYDSNNQLIRESGSSNYTFTWNNGNIITWESQGGKGDTWKDTYTYT